MEALIACLVVVIIIDAANLKKRSVEKFQQAFHHSFRFMTGATVLILLLFSLVPVDEGKIPAYLFFAILSIYALQRRWFLKSLNDANGFFFHEGSSSSVLKSDALGVIILWFLSLTAFSVIKNFFIDLYFPSESQMWELILTAIFSSFVLVALIYKVSLKFSDKGFMYNVGFHKAQCSVVQIAFIPAIIGLFFASFSAYIILARKIQPQTPLSDVLNAVQSPGAILIFLSLALIFAPFIEELIFRGYFFHVIARVKSERVAIYTIASIFAFLHVGQYWGDWLAILMVTILGFALTMLRAWSGSTIPSTVTHYVYNAGVTVIPILFLLYSNPSYFEYKFYFPMHDADKKEALLKESIRNDPVLADAYNDLAWLYVKENKNLQEALVLAEKALDFDPNVPAYIDTKAEVLFKLQRYDDSLKIRRDLLNREPSEYQRERIEEILKAKRNKQ